MPDQLPTEPSIPRQRTDEPAQPRDRRPAHRPNLLALVEVYSELGISRSTFYDWRAKGKAPQCIKLPNGELRIRRAVFERWLAALEEDVA
jgi:predicted DNA-binding transcriptional regulator AlpA